MIEISKRRDELVILPLALVEHLILRIAVDADPMSFSLPKLTLIFLLILVNHLAVTHLIFLEFALKPASFVELVMPDHLFIVPPGAVELISVGVEVEPLPVTFAIFYAAFVVLALGESNACVTLHQVLLELALVLCVLPFVVPSALLLGDVIVALEEVSVAVEDLPGTFDMRLVPVCLYFSPIRKGNNPKTILFAISKAALIK